MGTLLIIFTATLALCWAEQRVARIYPCDGDYDRMCSVSEVRIDGCSGTKYCTLTLGEMASMSVDFTPSDLNITLTNRDNTCDFTSCPTEAGKSQTLTYSGNILKKYPKGTFNLACKLWNQEDISQSCCFRTTIRLKR